MRHASYAFASGFVIIALAIAGVEAFGAMGGMGGTGGTGVGGGPAGSGDAAGRANGSNQISAARVFFNQGQEFAKKQSWHLAIQAYLQSVRLDPKFVDAWNNLGHAYRKTKGYDKALETYRRALDLQPDNARTHENLARAYLAMGNKDAATREYEILKRLNARMANELLQAIQANNADLGDSE